MKLEDAILAYKQKRNAEFQKNHKQHRWSLFGYKFGISYDDKMAACTKIMMLLNNEEAKITDAELAAMKDGELNKLLIKHRAEWPVNFRNQYNHPLISAINSYVLQRTTEFQRTQQQFYTNIDFGVSYNDKMHACNQLLKALNGENISFTESDVHALRNGSLSTIMLEHKSLWPEDYKHKWQMSIAHAFAATGGGMHP